MAKVTNKRHIAGQGAAVAVGWIIHKGSVQLLQRRFIGSISGVAMSLCGSIRLSALHVVLEVAQRGTTSAVLGHVRT